MRDDDDRVVEIMSLRADGVPVFRPGKAGSCGVQPYRKGAGKWLHSDWLRWVAAMPGENLGSRTLTENGDRLPTARVSKRGEEDKFSIFMTFFPHHVPKPIQDARR
jgi:hypothetical protein